ncbi:LytTR family DNA-binding domain-containing protein [Hyphobacterium sp.]|uniref:LytTR family DNA-binding domain-containing protein n=1 Tax=Hyphobacterium sp. TaxID=2004662 RepID=UPI003BA978BC
MQRIIESLNARTRYLLFLLGVGTFLAILGPYNTGGLGWPWVWIYWTGLMALGGYSGMAVSALLDRFAPDLPVWASYTIIAFLVALPVTVAVIALQSLIGPMPPIYFWPVIYGFVLVISGAVTLLAYLRDRPGQTTSTPAIGRTLTDKLPVRLRTADLFALQSEDHYLRVHTSRGDALILMRLSDAIAAAEGLEGTQTHRSWWVARAAIDHAEKSGGRAELTLTNGVTAPVSRRYYAELRDRGWI